MGWTDFPPAAHQATANSWIWHDQIRQALLEKYQAINISHFPLTPQTWAVATITAQGIDSRGWYVDFAPAMTCNNFDASLINTGIGSSHGNVDEFAAVVNDPNPKKCVRLGSMSISNFPVGHGTTSTRLYLTPPAANDPEYLDWDAVVGRELFIITGYGVEADPWWNERCLQPPNDVIANRKVHEGGGFTCSPGVLIDTTIGGYTGHHIWIGSDRFTITATTEHSITFANPNIDPLPTLADGDPYVVIHAEGFYKPGNKFFCWKWHDVIDDAWYTHDHTLADAGPTGGRVGQANLRAQTVRMFAPDGDGVCPTVGSPTDITEHDVWVAMTNWCDTPNTCKTPKIYRTIRGMQLAAYNTCGLFVKNIDYTGSKAIPTFVPATWFAAAGLNVLSLSGTSPVFVSTQWKVDVNGVDFDSFPDGALDDDGVWWALIDTTWGNAVIASGRAYSAADIPTITVPVDIPHTAAAGGNPEVPRQENVMIDYYEYGTPHSVAWVCSAGFTRTHPKEFHYAYERAGFVPEMYTVTVSGVTTTYVADPPTSDHPGTYDTRPASDHVTRADLHGAIQDSTFDYDLIADGIKARYLGDNLNDPGLTLTDYTPPATISRRTVQVESGDHTDGLLGPRLWYADQFREMEDFRRGAGASGTAAAGGTTFMTDSGKSWWPQGELIVHTGVADYGGTTSLTAPASDGFWAQTIGAYGRFVGMAVEVNIHDDVWEKRQITFQSGVNISWVEPMSVLASGQDFKITEPRGRLNYWKGRTITLTSPDGATSFEDVPITGSDNDTIYFAAQASAVGAGWSYSIYEMLPGAVYQRTSGAWVLPTEAGGSDAKSKNVHPDTLTRYGFARKRDYVNATLYAELRTGLDLLSATLGGPISWTANGENNLKSAGWDSSDGGLTIQNQFWIAGSAAGCVGYVNPMVDTNWGVYNPSTDLPADYYEGAADGGYIGGTWHGPGAWQTAYVGGPIDDGMDPIYYEGYRSASRVYAYGRKTNLPAIAVANLAGTLDVYTYCTIPSGDYWPDAQHVFNAYGDSVLWHQWSKYDSQPISSSVTTAKIGSTDKPEDPFAGLTLPAPWDPISFSLTEGYEVAQTQTVCRWTMNFHA